MPVSNNTVNMVSNKADIRSPFFYDPFLLHFLVFQAQRP